MNSTFRATRKRYPWQIIGELLFSLSKRAGKLYIGPVNFTAQILFFFGALGAFNALLLALYFLVGRTYTSKLHRFFGLYLLVLSLRVIKSVFFAFSTEEPIWFLQTGPTFFLLIGPLLFTYVIGTVNAESYGFKYKVHHISFWLLLLVLLSLSFPFGPNHGWYKETLLPIINAQWLVYLLVSAFYVRRNLEKIGKKTVVAHWLQLLLISNLFIWACFALITFSYFIGGAIVFSLFFYAFCFFFLRHRKTAALLFGKRRPPKIMDTSEATEKVIHTLETHIARDKPYLNPDLKIADVAQSLNIPPHRLSKIFNGNLHVSFAEYINSYRIEEAKRLIVEPSNFTIEAIGHQSGFNSKSAFYKAFKLHTGTTPAKYSP